MDIYASDDEKAEAIKQWWWDNGRSVVVGTVLSVAIIFLGKYWLSYQQLMAEKAAGTYHQVRNLIAEDRQGEADSLTQQLLSDFTNTPYSVFAAFRMANESTKTDDTGTAKIYLQWVLEHAQLSGNQELARLRLATLLLSESDLDAAMAMTDQSSSTAFASLFDELKGDILVQKSQLDDARKFYQKALLSLSLGEPREILLQMKLDDIAAING